MSKEKLRRIPVPFWVILALLIGVLGAGCGQEQSSAPSHWESNSQTSHQEPAPSVSPIPVKTASFLAYNHPVNQLLIEVMKPMLEEKTQGRYTLEVYADGDLGGESDFLKGVSNGTIEMAVLGVEMSETFPALKVLDFPFVFEDIDSSFQALEDPEVLDAFNQQIESSSVLCAGFVLTGVRAISNNIRPIRTPEDCEGIILREPNVNQFIEYAHRLGFQTIVASVPEIFTALQQKQADGQENPPLALLTSGWYQVQDYLSLTNHQLTYNWLGVNKEFYETMTEEDRQAFDECCSAYVKTVKETYQEQEAEVLESLREKGVEIIEVDREPFRKVGLELIEDYCQRYPAFQETLSLIRDKGAR